MKDFGYVEEYGIGLNKWLLNYVDAMNVAVRFCCLEFV
jgi:hypothetical protein